MTQEQKPTENKDLQTSLSAKVLSRIESEHIEPSPKWQFLFKESTVWVLWGISVSVGAIAVAVMWYVADHARLSLYEATHETPFLFFVEVLPYLWIVCFLGMAAFAYYNLRHTKRGYKYPLWQIIVSSVVFSLIGGLTLSLAGIGELIDTSFGRNMPTYQSMEKKEMAMWQMPDEGRLVVTYSADQGDGMHYELLDAKGELWQVSVFELKEPDLALIKSGKSVRLLGTTTDLVNRQFHACGAFPWMFREMDEVNLMLKERQKFLSEMREHLERGERLKGLRGQMLEEEVYEQTFMEGLCADIAAVKRINFSH